MAVNRIGTYSGLGTAVDRLSEHAVEWGPERLLDEGMDLVRDSTWADVSVLHSVTAQCIEVVALRPGPGSATTEPNEQSSLIAVAQFAPLDWFPWGLAPVSPERFLLVDDAGALPISPGSAGTVASIGMRSCLHLPILERRTPVGALHLYWSEPRLAWDDDHGCLLRTLGRFLLSTAVS
jgi:GAF domain-containing protein